MTKIVRTSGIVLGPNSPLRAVLAQRGVRASTTQQRVNAPARMEEHHAQCAVVDWAMRNSLTYPDLRWLFAIPNANGTGSRKAQGKLNAEGLKRGVYDMMLPVARGGYFGMFIEHKVLPRGPTEEQVMFGAMMRDRGYKAIVSYVTRTNITQTTTALITYLSQPRTESPYVNRSRVAP